MKAIRETAIKYAQKVYPKICGEHDKNIDGAILANSANSFIDGVEFAQRWISVDKELPEIKEKIYKILIKYSDGDVQDYWVRKKGYCTEKDILDNFKENDVTHWRLIELT